MDKPYPNPDLLDLIRDWLKASPYSSEWDIGDSRKAMEEVKKVNPNLNGPDHLGTLHGYGWIYSIWADRIDSFFEQEDWANGNELMASDPFFFERLEASLEIIRNFRENKTHISELFPTI